MNHHFSTSAVAGFCVSLLLPAVSIAGTIYSNFGPSQSYDTSVGNPVGNAFDGNNYAEGATFTPATTAPFGSLQIALSYFLSQPISDFTVALTQDNGDQPGSVIESFTVSGALLGPLGNNNVPLFLDSITHPSLVSGTRYWITVATADVSSSIDWNLNSTGDSSDQALSTDGSATWFSPSGLTPGAYQVNSAAVPEHGSHIPDTFLLLPLAMSLLGKFRRF